MKKDDTATKFEIIPAIDIIDGKCVRLTKGDYDQKKVYNENPLEVALQFQDAGLQRLHLVDLDGAKAGKVINWKILEQLTAHTQLKIDFGGGLKKEEDVRIVIQAGALWVTVGSIAAKQEPVFTQWLDIFGADKFFLGADVKEGYIAVNGWMEQTGIEVMDFIGKYTAKGVNHLFCTDVSKDGMLQGPSIDLYKKIIAEFPSLYFVASGGVSSLEDIKQLEAIGCSAAIVGKAIYENRISLQELSSYYA